MLARICPSILLLAACDVATDTGPTSMQSTFCILFAVAAHNDPDSVVRVGDNVLHIGNVAACEADLVRGFVNPTNGYEVANAQVNPVTCTEALENLPAVPASGETPDNWAWLVGCALDACSRPRVVQLPPECTLSLQE